MRLDLLRFVFLVHRSVFWSFLFVVDWMVVVLFVSNKMWHTEGPENILPEVAEAKGAGAPEEVIPNGIRHSKGITNNSLLASPLPATLTLVAGNTQGNDVV